jgi:hypothetical protein
MLVLGAVVNPTTTPAAGATALTATTTTSAFRGVLDSLASAGGDSAPSRRVVVSGPSPLLLVCARLLNLAPKFSVGNLGRGGLFPPPTVRAVNKRDIEEERRMYMRKVDTWSIFVLSLFQSVKEKRWHFSVTLKTHDWRRSMASSISLNQYISIFSEDSHDAVVDEIVSWRCKQSERIVQLIRVRLLVDWLPPFFQGAHGLH